MISAKRAAPYALLAAAAIAAAWPILRVAGMPYDVDISGFFPLSPEAYQARFWPLWNEHGGISTLQFLPALAFELPLLLVGHAFGWGMDIHLKVRIVLGFALAGMSMYALARRYVLRRRPAAPESVLVLAPLAAGLLYMLNPWSVHRVFHYFLWIGYAMAPLVVLAFERLADSPTWRRALVFAGTVALATTDPHNPATFAILLAPIALVRLVTLARADHAQAWKLLRGVGVAAAAYLAFAAYWILPYAYNALHNPGFGPSYVMSQEMLDTLSRHGGFLDALRLLHNYLPRGDLQPDGGFALQAWTLASYAVPLLAFGALLLDRTRVAWTYAALAAAMVVLGMGSRGPFPGAYAWLLFGAPWGEGLSWLFRDPYRWGGLQALAYSVLFALSLAAIGSALPRLSLPRAAPAVGLALVLVFAGPALASYTNGPYKPLVVPSEYAQANAHLASAGADAGVVWMPRMLGDTTWSGDRTLEYFDATSSGAMAMGPFRPATSTYFDFLQDAIKDGADIAPLLARAGADRIVYHNDMDVAGGARTIRQIENLGLQNAGTFGASPTLVADPSSLAPTYTPSARIALFGDHEVAQTFVPNATTFASLSLRAVVIGAPGPMRIAIDDASGHEVFARGVSMKTTDREVSIDLGGLKLLPGGNDTIRLRTTASDDANRYDISYYKVDTYPGGALQGTDGDLAFEFLAQARGFVVSLESHEPAPRIREAPGGIASSGGLQLLRALETLPANGSMRDAPVAFLNQDPATRRAFAAGEGNWSWVGAFEDQQVATVVPFLPTSDFKSPFGDTTRADATDGWARGTQDFSYYNWGWQRSLSQRGQESWEFDGADGLAYASVRGNLTMDVSTHEPSVMLARLYESPKGGTILVHAGDSLVGRIDTRDDVAGFRWVEVGTVPDGATSLRIETLGGLQGVNLVAVVPAAAYADATQAAAARMATTPVTLLAQAETIPALDDHTVAVPGVGRVAEIVDPVTLKVLIPVASNYTLWIRAPREAPSPLVRFDGAARAAPTCAEACTAPAVWRAVEFGRVEAGAHTLVLASGGDRAQIDVMALTTDSTFAGGRAPPLTWTRVSATEYRATPAAGFLALAVPYDPGWVAVTSTGERIRAIAVDGVANGFVIPPAAGEIVITYEPQTWAQAGVGIALTTTLCALGIAGASTWRRKLQQPNPEEVYP